MSCRCRPSPSRSTGPIERDRKGKEVATRRFRGVASVVLIPPQDEAVIRLNPIGLYLKDFDWTAQI